MKTNIKKMKYFPVTTASGVYLDNSNITLQDLINSGALEEIAIEKLKAYSTKLLNFKGEFDYNKYDITKGNAKTGDFWIYKDSTIVSFDGSIAYKNNIVYLDSDGLLKTIYIPLTNDITPKQKYDVCIVGGGAGGIGAAYALKDSGLRVCIIERNDVLGGTHCCGIGMIANPICSWYKPIVQEAYGRGMMKFRNNSTSDKSPLKVGNGSEFDKIWRASQFGDPKNVINNFVGNCMDFNVGWLSEKYFNDLNETIDIFINCELTTTNSNSRNVESVVAVNRVNGKQYTIFADYFIDCSGDGVLFTSDKNLKLDTDYYIGTDPKTRFNEGVYPSNYEGDHNAINTVEPLVFMAGMDGTKTKFKLIPNRQHYKKFPDDNMVQKANGGGTFPHPTYGKSIQYASWSYGSRMNLQDFVEKSSAYNEAIGYDRAYALYCNNGTPPATNISSFCGIGKMLAIREKFRIACEKTVTQDYLTTKITSSNYGSEHIIALSTWYVDIHNQTYHCGSNIPNGVPYEAMIPKCYSNALVACRAYGASHIGLSSIRLIKTMLDLGYSAGTAIKQLCYSDTRGDVRTVNVADVQNERGILDVIQELETYFFGSTVTTE